MPILHLIPDDVPAADRRQVLNRIRRDIGCARALYDVHIIAPVPNLMNIKRLRTRLRSLKAMESAWLSVQMDGAA